MELKGKCKTLQVTYFNYSKLDYSKMNVSLGILYLNEYEYDKIEV